MRVLFLFTGFLFCLFLKAQEASTVLTTAVPFLTIASDARSSGMGDVGIATAPDAFSMQWNPAKYSFIESNKGFALGYTPYLENIISDIALLSGAYYKRLNNNRGAFSIGLRYFTLGAIELRQFAADPGLITQPNEIAIDGSYALKLSPNFSMAVGGRFIRSNLKFPQEVSIDSRAASSVAVDLAAFYMGNFEPFQSFEGRWRWGVNLSNLGPKIAYDASGQQDFLPANLGIGIGYDFVYHSNSALALSIDLNKYLVPIPQDYNQDGVIDATDLSTYQSIDFLQGALDSFSDTSGSFLNELKEFRIGIGLEYTLMQMLMLRTGYFTESQQTGTRRFLTIGTGVRLKNLQIDFSYLFSTSQVRNPLENTLRFSLSFHLDKNL